MEKPHVQQYFKTLVEDLQQQQDALTQFVNQWCVHQRQILQAERTQAVPLISKEHSLAHSHDLEKIEQERSPTSPRSPMYRGSPQAPTPSQDSKSLQNETPLNSSMKSHFSPSGTESFRAMRSICNMKGKPCSPQKPCEAPKNAIATCRLWISYIVLSHWFESASGVLIFANALVIAYATDYAAQQTDDTTARLPATARLEAGFTVLYAVELMLRWITHGRSLLGPQQRMWCFFDFSLLLTAVYHQAVIFIDKDFKSNLVILRTLRVIRMIKVLRMVRVFRLFKELRLIVASITGSMKSMFWAVMLIIIITFIVGITFLQASTSYLIDNKGNLMEEQIIEIQSYWGRLSTAMLALYMASTGGDSWKAMANSLIPVGYSFYILFLLYISFFLFVVMNTLTSLFIENAIQNAEKDKSMVIRDTIQQKKEYMKRAVELFQSLDQDGSGVITEEEFEMHAQDAEMVAFASSLEIDVLDVAQFYDMISCNGRYTVDCETFVVGCMALKGTARSMDLQGLVALQKRVGETLDTVARECKKILGQIEDLTQQKLSLSL